ncbi:FlgT C-terminal domain-containing protein [Dethiosulfovibrio salsuginis]|uniref:Flagellar assembly protein T, C-terminal domain n=1 Tax=Dethiosulfovibrio salsuginis TaxID=561720 RepID=A0A1X7JXQ2_9BACT|nr:FlgT C-terminal domain-containing protein [Dethiosulfovibrio salsuginis]SMG32640.1 Flagellar assembly protein T, C-terminal domain [Dethiosulfovibrio salsuginis]
MTKYFIKVTLLVLCLASAAKANVLTEPGLHIALLPIVNETDIQVWESKYYPVDVFPQKVIEEFVTLLREYPYARITVLSPMEGEVWLRGGSVTADIGVRLHVYKLKMTDRKHLGTDRMGYVAIRMEVFEGEGREMLYATSLAGEDRRFTFSPGDDRIFYLADKLDFVQLFPDPKDDDQPMSKPLWSSFRGTPYWNAFKKALAKSRDALFDGITGYHMVGRIISPTKDSLSSSPPNRRRYIVSLGRVEGVKVGDLLSILRSDRYDTVDPERPVVVLPDRGGLVKVISVQNHEAVVEVVRESQENPIKLRDLVIMPLYPSKRR